MRERMVLYKDRSRCMVKNEKKTNEFCGKCSKTKKIDTTNSNIWYTSNSLAVYAILLKYPSQI